MKSVKKVACAVLVAFVGVNLHGCGPGGVIDRAYDYHLSRFCEQMVDSYVEEEIANAYQNLETNCSKAYPIKDRALECIALGVAYLMAAEKTALSNYTKKCVDTVNDKVADRDLTSLQQYGEDWWYESSGTIQKDIRDKFANAQPPMDEGQPEMDEVVTIKGDEVVTIQGFDQEGVTPVIQEGLSQGKDASIVFMCNAKSNSEINKMILAAKDSLMSQCQNSSVSDHAGCQEKGDNALNDIAVAGAAKWAADCENSLRGALTFDSVDHLPKHLDDWWNADGQKLKGEVTKMASDAISSAKVSSTVTSRLYDAATSHVDPPPQKPSVSTIVVAAGSIGLVTMLVGAFVVRLLRPHANAHRDVEQVAINEEEIE